MSFVPLDHIRTERSTSEPVHQHDHGRTRTTWPTSDSLRWEFEDGVVGSYSSVVDKDGGGAELFSNLVCGSIHSVGVGNVTLDIVGDDYLSVSCLIGRPQRYQGEVKAYSPDSSRSGRGETSRITTLTPLLANALAISSPIPEHPPVTTAISSFQFQRPVSASLQLFRASSVSWELR
jgi:hypothetical protein